MENPRIIGHVVSVNGFRVKVELLTEARSPSRATLDGVQTAVAINSYLTFSIGSGLSVIGVITDLEARESYDPASGDELSLDFIKARRIASVQLLGTIEREVNQWQFNPGITILPTLDTPAEIGSPKTLAAVFENPPKRNKPDGYEGNDFDFDLVLGYPTGQKSNRVKASYNDLFSRPLAIVGNTGSGKSYSVASLIKKAMQELGDDETNAPHIFILDINGEYARAFLPEKAAQYTRQPDHVYLNGEEFGIPLWFFNAQEICAWLSASEQTQEPVLKDWWAIVKSKQNPAHKASGDNTLRHALTKIETLIECLDSDKPVKKTACTLFSIAKSYWDERKIDDVADLEQALQPHMGQATAQGRNIDWDRPDNERAIREAAQKVQTGLKNELSKDIAALEESANTADTPLFISRIDLMDPTLVDRAVSQEDVGRIESHLTTLKLRLKTRLDDKRWKSLFNYEKEDTKFTNLEDWLQRYGFSKNESPRVSIVDLSMLAHDTLPYVCCIIGRILLETRERLPASERYKHPWGIVLEEAHNYARPPRQNEDRGQALSRMVFERIAKEGRKFGLSLIVASQRPSEISPTIISQCANFVSHRLQNPDDIDHFRRIIPMQARRLLDQVTVLASGEAIVFGSAFHIPTRVQIDVPQPSPWSQTAAPYHQWKTNNEAFPLKAIMANWKLQASDKRPASDDTSQIFDDLEDDMPF
ncbi:MAG: DUF87 domain-containing protein [Nitrosomonas sp.]|nr:DUF87 domain-containing protein [Nitrosomonas sp.]